MVPATYSCHEKAVPRMSAMDTVVRVHPLTENPSEAWEDIQHSQIVHHVEMLPLDFPLSSKAIRFVCMSDTHSLLSRIKFTIPNGDVFIHAGDFTRCGSYNEIVDFNRFLGSLPHKYKIVIAGNHELTFDPLTINSLSTRPHFPTIQQLQKLAKKSSPSETRDFSNLLTNCIYLQDELTEVFGIKIYGTPWQPRFFNWAFNLPRGRACLEKWNMIPEGIDILVSHTPPIGHGDLCIASTRVGCVELLHTVQKRVKPKYHVFGHIHEGYGITTDGQTIFINASTCNVNYKPVNLPVIFDIPLPENCTKE